MNRKFLFSIVFLLAFFHQKAIAKDYFIHPVHGNDLNSGESKNNPFKTLESILKLNLLPGDRIVLASGEVYTGSLKLVNQKGSLQNPIVITTISWKNDDLVTLAIIDFKNHANGILLEDCSFIKISNIELIGNGYTEEEKGLKMRCGIVLTSKNSKRVEHILIQNMFIHDVFFENPGFIRGKEEVKSANGTQKYGWGIRLINDNPENIIENITIDNCHINSVCHTGIKLTGNNKNIKHIELLNNTIENTGGPGIQMSEVAAVYVAKNKIIFLCSISTSTSTRKLYIVLLGESGYSL